MQKEIFSESVPRQSLPPHVQKKFPKVEVVRVYYEPDHEVELDDDGKPMPPASKFSPEFIKALEESEKDIQEGRYTKVNPGDVRKHLDSLWKHEFANPGILGQ
mmetsp:Transcript_16842/g.7987  ORF Transcript_16842/g.7987 Transcript_16842/m.7987 type:complete len:103 (+) Transcript_16842:251-559(+)